MEFSEQDKQDIIQALKSVAVATAEFWDVLRAIEVEHDEENLTLETDIYLVNQLAAECNHPPKHRDLNPEWVWEMFEEHTKVQVVKP